jgi:hypothetical protein
MMTGFAVVDMLTRRVIIECFTLETLDLIMAGRNAQFIAIMTDATVYNPPLSFNEIFIGVNWLKNFRVLTDRPR